MTFQTLFLAGVTGAFSVLWLTLFAVTLWSRGARPAPVTHVTPAKRPEPAAGFDLAA